VFEFITIVPSRQRLDGEQALEVTTARVVAEDARRRTTPVELRRIAHIIRRLVVNEARHREPPRVLRFADCARCIQQSLCLALVHHRFLLM
jgi:hypothetical protein